MPNADGRTEPTLLVLDRRRGRPRSIERSVTLSTWVPERLYDRLVELAGTQKCSVSTLVKSQLTAQLVRDQD